MVLVESENYRKDIDGLRAYAVLAVVIFHIGSLPNGFLGVDVFFVISGYLITGIIYRKILDKSFSIKEFYIRRTKRIIPLVSFICLVSLILGVKFMLPDDLENLAQSVIATNLFNNNTLQVLTTKNYWDVINELKPLMHTWSLAIEEQYYLFYRFLFLLISKIKIKLILPVLGVLTLISIALFLSPFQDYYKFYLLPFRFFELSLGGISAIILKGKIIKHQFSVYFILMLIFILCFEINFVNKNILLILTVLSCLILISDNKENSVSSFLLENNIVVFIGKISFSVYMWHQLLLAFGRYFLFKEPNIIISLLIIIITFLLSITTYYLIEQPFRNKIKTKNVIWTLILVFLFTTGISLHIHQKGGVLKDIPELNIKKVDAKNNIHAKYNDAILELDREFTDSKQTKIIFGHTRLSILDLDERSNQPFEYKNKNQKVLLTYNGEIYNFEEIKQILIVKGYNFKTNSIAEVIAASYLEWGCLCFDYFVGMWAIAINDNNKLIFARDRVGKKPFYYSISDDGFISFSSSIKAVSILSGENLISKEV